MVKDGPWGCGLLGAFGSVGHAKGRAGRKGCSKALSGGRKGSFSVCRVVHNAVGHSSVNLAGCGPMFNSNFSRQIGVAFELI